MWRTSVYRTPCEVLREINDLFQGDEEIDRIVRKKLAEVEAKTKEMSLFIDKYDKKFHERWKPNVDANVDAEFRETETYKYHKI